MLHTTWVRAGLLILIVGAFFNCSENPVAPDDLQSSNLSRGIPKEDITWVTWNAEVTAAIEAMDDPALARRWWRGFDSGWIQRDEGGTVGGWRTFRNRVDFPANAFIEDELEISVRVLHYNWWGQTAAGVEFLPSRNYEADLHITLNWGFLDVDPGEWEDLDLQPYYSEDGGETWYPVEEYEVNPSRRTITFDIDHFTQYGWGLDDCD